MGGKKRARDPLRNEKRTVRDQILAGHSMSLRQPSRDNPGVLTGSVTATGQDRLFAFFDTIFPSSGKVKWAVDPDEWECPRKQLPMILHQSHIPAAYCLPNTPKASVKKAAEDIIANLAEQELPCPVCQADLTRHKVCEVMLNKMEAGSKLPAHIDNGPVPVTVSCLLQPAEVNPPRPTDPAQPIPYRSHTTRIAHPAQHANTSLCSAGRRVDGGCSTGRRKTLTISG